MTGFTIPLSVISVNTVYSVSSMSIMLDFVKIVELLFDNRFFFWGEKTCIFHPKTDMAKHLKSTDVRVTGCIHAVKGGGRLPRIVLRNWPEYFMGKVIVFVQYIQQKTGQMLFVCVFVFL